MLGFSRYSGYFSGLNGCGIHAGIHAIGHLLDGYQRMVTRPVTNETALFRRCFQPQVSKGVSTETCQNLTFEAVCKDAVRGLVRTESGALAQVSAGRLAPWLAPIEGVDRTAVDAPPLARLWTLPAFAKGDTARLGSGTKEKAQDSYGRPDQQAGSSVAPIAGLSDFIHRAAGKCWHVG